MKFRSLGAISALVILGMLGLGAVPVAAADAPSPSAVPAPVCDDRDPPPWVTGASHPNDGVPDPSGRIVFGRESPVDDLAGQIVSLYAIDPDGSDLVQLLDCQAVRPRWSRDGTRLAFGIAMDDRSLQLATMAADGTDMRVLTSTTGYADTPDWSPDDSWLVYSHSPERCPSGQCLQHFRQSLWRVEADGSGERLIGDPHAFDWEPRMSPDGSEVVLSRVNDLIGDFTLVIRDLATGEEREVMASDRGPEHPEWSPDGAWVIYDTLHPAGSDSLLEQIERVRADDPTAAPEVLYPSDPTRTDLGYKPTYSPDGSGITFICGGRLCRMDVDGSNVVVIIEVPGVALNHVTWGIAAKPGN